MSMKLLKSTVELTSFVKNFDDNEMVATYEDELTFMDPVYEEIIVGFIAKLRPIERFIFYRIMSIVRINMFILLPRNLDQ